MDDQRMIDLFFERSEQAIEAVTEKYGSLFVRIAENFLGQQEAEEAVNDLYFTLWNQIPPERPKHFKAYAVKILRNIAVKRHHADTAQKRSSRYEVALEEIAPYLPGGQTPEEVLSAKELAKQLNAFLGTLSRQDRAFFVRRYYLGESPAQIGRALGKTSHYVSVRLHRIRERLRVYFVREGIYI